MLMKTSWKATSDGRKMDLTINFVRAYGGDNPVPENLPWLDPKTAQEVIDGSRNLLKKANPLPADVRNLLVRARSWMETHVDHCCPATQPCEGCQVIEDLRTRLARP